MEQELTEVVEAGPLLKMKIKRGLNSKTFSKSQCFQSYAEDMLILPPSLRENLNFIEYVGRRVSEHGGVTGQMSTPAPSY